MATNQQMSTKLATRGASDTPLSFEQNVSVWFKQNAKRMTTLAGSREDANKIIASMLYVASRTPKLLSCSIDSIGECLLHSAGLNLFPGPLEECAYVPFKGRATFIPQYQGLCKLAYNSGHVRSITSGVVYENDVFEFSNGTDEFLRHIPLLADRAARGDRIAAWCVVKTLQGHQIEVQPIDFIETTRKRAPAGKMNDSPWNASPETYDAMARKTMLRQALKTIPKSTRLAKALDIDASDIADPVIEFDETKVVGAIAQTDTSGASKQ